MPSMNPWKYWAGKAFNNYELEISTSSVVMVHHIHFISSWYSTIG